MNGKMIGKLASTMMLTALVVGMAGVARATLVYSEDFNSYSAGNALSVAGWTGAGAATVKLSAAPFDAANESGFDAAGLYVDGRTSAVSNAAYINVGYHNTGIWTLRADLKFTGSGDSNFGLRDSDPDTHLHPGYGPLDHVFTDHAYRPADETSTGFFSNWWYNNGSDGLPLRHFFYDPSTTGWRAEIVMDYDNLRFKGTLTNINAYTEPAGYTSTTGWLTMNTDGVHPAQNFFGFDQIAIWNAHTNASSVQVDNIMLYEGQVPEPSTLALLVTGMIGLVCYAWRKRK